MKLRMKNFNLGVHLKTRILWGGFHTKPIYRGDCLRRMCFDKGGGWIKKKRWCFLGIETPMHTTNMENLNLFHFISLFWIYWDYVLLLLPWFRVTKRSGKSVIMPIFEGRQRKTRKVWKVYFTKELMQSIIYV